MSARKRLKLLFRDTFKRKIIDVKERKNSEKKRKTNL